MLRAMTFFELSKSILGVAKTSLEAVQKVLLFALLHFRFAMRHEGRGFDRGESDGAIGEFRPRECGDGGERAVWRSFAAADT